MLSMEAATPEWGSNTTAVQAAPPKVFNLINAPSANLQTEQHHGWTFATSHENIPDTGGIRDFVFTHSVQPSPGDLILKRHDNGEEKTAWEIREVSPAGVDQEGRYLWRGVMRDLFYRSTPTESQCEAIRHTELGMTRLTFRTGLLFTPEVAANPGQAAAVLETERRITVDAQVLRDIAPHVPGMSILVAEPNPGVDLRDFFDEAAGEKLGGTMSTLLLGNGGKAILLTPQTDLTAARKEFLEM